jgi:hypothetical protein
MSKVTSDLTGYKAKDAIIKALKDPKVEITEFSSESAAVELIGRHGIPEGRASNPNFTLTIHLRIK